MHADEVTCYLCKTSIHEWKSNDVPLERHLEANKNCSWATLKKTCLDWVDHVERGLQEFNPNHEDAPWSRKMLKCRIDTFGKWWIHEKDPNHLCKIQDVSF